MKTILILDTETTGLDPAKDRVIEVACVRFDVESASTVGAFSVLLHSDGDNSNPAHAINRIPEQALAKGWAPIATWEMVAKFAPRADAVVAHRAEFDRSFVPPRVLGNVPWICSKFDIEWPLATREGESLVPLALAHGLGVSHAHRAMADCDLIARLFSRVAEMGHDIDSILTRAMRPKGTFQALVSFDDRELAKAAGFRWEPETKRWTRRMFVEKALALSFRTKRLDEPQAPAA